MKMKKGIIWGLALPAILVVGILSGCWLSRVNAEEKNLQPIDIKLIGVYSGQASDIRNSAYRVFVHCDVERGSLIYIHIAQSANLSLASDMVVIKDGCKGTK